MDENDWNIPEHLVRYWSGEAIDVLARRFNLPNTPFMQDWPWEVADYRRIEEFLDAYDDDELGDDERFVLMDILIQSAEDLGSNLAQSPVWLKIQDRLDKNIALHIYHVWYWACLENEHLADAWQVAPTMRALLKKYQHQFELPEGWNCRLNAE